MRKKVIYALLIIASFYGGTIYQRCRDNKNKCAVEEVTKDIKKSGAIEKGKEVAEDTYNGMKKNAKWIGDSFKD